MRRLRAADAVVLVSLLSLWVSCAALHVKQVARGQLAWVGVYVAAPPGDDGFPTVRGFWPGATRDASGDLAIGDRLVSVGGAELRGVGPFGFVARTYAAAAERRDLRVPLAYERGGAGGETTIDLVPVAFPWRILPLTCTLVITGALVLARRPGTRIARAFFLLAVAYGLHWTLFFGGSRLQSHAWVVVFACASGVMLPLILRGALIFPAEVAPAGGRLPWPWHFAAFGPISLSWIYGVPLPPEVGFRAVFVVNVAFIAVVLAVLTRNFRRAGPIGRRQLKWVVLGMYVGTVPVLLTDVVGAVAPSMWWLHEAAVIAEIAIPLCVLIAIVRSNFLDVDRLITGAAVYSVLSIVLLAAVLTAVPQIALAASTAAAVVSGGKTRVGWERLIRRFRQLARSKTVRFLPSRPVGPRALQGDGDPSVAEPLRARIDVPSRTRRNSRSPRAITPPTSTTTPTITPRPGSGVWMVVPGSKSVTLIGPRRGRFTTMLPIPSRVVPSNRPRVASRSAIASVVRRFPSA